MVIPASKKASIILEVSNLSIQGRSPLATVAILNDINLRLRRGEILGLIGESGSGKSTLGLAAMGFVRAGCRITSGQVFFRGDDLLRMSESDRRHVRGAKIAYVAQSAAESFNPARRILGQSVEVPIRNMGWTRAGAVRSVIELFRQLQLPDPDNIGRRYPHEVSGGQLQRAMTAMAMAPRPDIIIFDEPTTALDVTTQVEVLVAIRQVVRVTGTAAIYISHDLAVIAQMADRVMVLHNGMVIEEGRTEDILERPQQPYTASLVGQRRTIRFRTELYTKEILRGECLSRSYGGFLALSDVNICIHAGETFAVVGESGSGKTTLARVVAGLMPRASGKLYWHGEPLEMAFNKRRKEQLRRIQLVYQMPDTALNPRMSVGAILNRPFRFYFKLNSEERTVRVKRLLELVELNPDQLLARLPSQLSGGEKQRLCIARALAAEPDLLICDEVTSALDPIVAEGILNLLSRLQRELGVAYLFITHDMTTVQSIADTVAVMSNGVIVDQGTKQEVLNPPRNRFTDKLMLSTPTLARNWLDNLLAARTGKEEIASPQIV
jgi:peptide/nickel transport system ATP-binding protein